MDTTELCFIDHYQTLHHSGLMDNLMYALGLSWNLDAIRKQAEVATPTTPSNEIFIPLSVVINPKIMEYVKEQAGIQEKKNVEQVDGYVPKENEKITSMGNLNKEEFKAMLGIKPKP